MCDRMTVIYEFFSYCNTVYASVRSEMGQFCIRSFLMFDFLLNKTFKTI